MKTDNLQETISASIAKSLANLTQSVLSPLANVAPPKFSGDKNQVVDWLDQFEQITHVHPDGLKKKPLAISLTHSARSWYIDDLEPIIDTLTWKEVKTRMLQ